MVIFDIPKEFRVSTKIDTSFKFCFIFSPLSYISIRTKNDNSEVAFFCMNIDYCIDIQKLKSSFDFDVSISVVTDSRNSNLINYSMYDSFAYKSVDYIKEVE